MQQQLVLIHAFVRHRGCHIEDGWAIHGLGTDRAIIPRIRGCAPRGELYAIQFRAPCAIRVHIDSEPQDGEPDEKEKGEEDRTDETNGTQGSFTTIRPPFVECNGPHLGREEVLLRCRLGTHTEGLGGIKSRTRGKPAHETREVGEIVQHGDDANHEIQHGSYGCATKHFAPGVKTVIFAAIHKQFCQFTPHQPEDGPGCTHPSGEGLKHGGYNDAEDSAGYIHNGHSPPTKHAF